MKPAHMRFLVRQLLHQHRGSVRLCVLSMAFATALLMSVVGIRAQAEAAFGNSDMGFNAVIGPRGSQLQLVLNSLFHIDQPTGVLSWKRYQDIKNDRRILEAWPITVGDNYHGFHIVGCEAAMLAEHEIAEGQPLRISGEGRIFDPLRAEAVVGAFVAEQLGLQPGDTFYSYHGFEFDEGTRHDLVFTVVGVLEATNTPMDRALWVPLESYYRMPGHALYGDGEEYIARDGVAIPERHKEVSAVLCRIRPSSGLALNYEINRNSSDLTFAWPLSTIVLELFENLSWVDAVLAVIAVLVLLIVNVFIGSTLFQYMQLQQRDFVLLRALGARRGTLSCIILGQSLVIAVRALLWSVPLYAVLLGIVAMYLRAATGVYLTLWFWHPILLVAPLLVLIMALIVGLAPALRVYGGDVAGQLAEEST